MGQSRASQRLLNRNLLTKIAPHTFSRPGYHELPPEAYGDAGCQKRALSKQSSGLARSTNDATSSGASWDIPLGDDGSELRELFEEILQNPLENWSSEVSFLNGAPPPLSISSTRVETFSCNGEPNGDSDGEEASCFSDKQNNTGCHPSMEGDLNTWGCQDGNEEVPFSLQAVEESYDLNVADDQSIHGKADANTEKTLEDPGMDGAGNADVTQATDNGTGPGTAADSMEQGRSRTPSQKVGISSCMQLMIGKGPSSECSFEGSKPSTMVMEAGACTSHAAAKVQAALLLQGGPSSQTGQSRSVLRRPITPISWTCDALSRESSLELSLHTSALQGGAPPETSAFTSTLPTSVERQASAEATKMESFSSVQDVMGGRCSPRPPTQPESTGRYTRRASFIGRTVSSQSMVLRSEAGGGDSSFLRSRTSRPRHSTVGLDIHNHPLSPSAESSWSGMQTSLGSPLASCHSLSTDMQTASPTAIDSAMLAMSSPRAATAVGAGRSAALLRRSLTDIPCTGPAEGLGHRMSAIGPSKDMVVSGVAVSSTAEGGYDARQGREAWCSSMDDRSMLSRQASQERGGRCMNACSSGSESMARGMTTRTIRPSETQHHQAQPISSAELLEEMLQRVSASSHAAGHRGGRRESGSTLWGRRGTPMHSSHSTPSEPLLVTSANGQKERTIQYLPGSNSVRSSPSSSMQHRPSTMGGILLEPSKHVILSSGVGRFK